MTGVHDDLSDGRGRSRAQRRAWLGVAAVAVAMGGLLVGTGFDLGRLTGGDDNDTDTDTGPLAALDDVDWEAGVAVASDVHDGAGAELVVASAAEEARCAGVRTDRATEPTPVRCSLDGFINPWDEPDWAPTVPSDHFGFIEEVPVRDGSSWSVMLAGAVSPTVVRVTAHLGDGGEYSFVTRNPGGWFVVGLPDDIADPDVETGALVNELVFLDLYDAEGTRLTIVDLTARPEVT